MFTYLGFFQEPLITHGSSFPFWEENVAVFQSLNSLSANPFFAKISPLLADGPILFLPLFLVSLWLYYSYKKQNDAKPGLMFLFYAAALAHIFSIFIQQFIVIERPETAITNSGKLLMKHIPDASFPSDHASVSVAFLVGLYLLGYKKTFFAFAPWVVLMLLSRVIVGVHWPFDILVGSFVGAAAGYISLQYLSKIKFVKNINSFIIRILSYIKL